MDNIHGDDILGKVTADQDFIRKILSKIPGFKGYIERENRRASDKLLREYIADQFSLVEQRISSLQRDLISQGQLEAIDDLEAAAIKIRQFTDRVRRAAYGYGSLFEAVKINEEELSKIYAHDQALLDSVSSVQSAVDNVEASIGAEGFPASVRHLTALAQEVVETFNKRSAIILTDAGAVQ
jgi:hypothetical protein